MKEALKTLILHFQETGVPEDLIPREQGLSPFLETRNAVVISGPSRIGLGSELFMLFQYLL